MMVPYSNRELRAGLASVSNLQRALELIILGCALLFLGVPDAIATRGDPLHKTLVAMTYGNLPLRFEGNRGQTDDQVQFFHRGHQYTLFLTPTEAVLVSSRPPQESILRLQLRGANPTPKITGLEELPGASHYFIGNEQQQWRTHVPTYARVKYEAVYPGIDLVYYGNQGQLEYDFLVAPGADPQAITLSYTGADALEIDAQGALVLHVPGGQVRWHTPIIYQEHDGIKHRVSGGYILRDSQQVGFALGPYDPTRPLVIDPVLVYATFLGGSNHDAGLGIAVDAEGAAYVTGMTASLNFPLATPVQSAPGGGYDAFVVKLSPDGSRLIYATYLGGSSDENMYEGLAYGGIAVDAAGAAYITGSTTSRDFPAVQALQPAHGGSLTDAFVAKLSPDGSRLVYATYLGGSGIDMGRSIAVDAAGAAYITGQNESEDFPTVRPFQPTHGGFFKDAFITKIDATGSQLVYSSHLGGNHGDLGFGIAVDTAGNAYVFGETGSPNFPTTRGAFDTVCGTDGACDGSGDLFITKVHATGETLVYSTYLGGSGEDRIAASHGIAVDMDGGVYVTGHTLSPDFPNTHGQQLNGPSDAIVAKLNAQGTALVYAVFLGGAGGDNGYAIAVDLAHNAYITGGTGGNFPVTVETYRCGDPSAFVTKLRADGSTAYALCLSGGGIAKDRGHGLAVDQLGNAYVTGFTASSDFPTVNAMQPVHGGGNDAFVVKITDSLASVAIERKYRELGGLQGLLGVPVTDQLSVPDGVGQRRHFHHGSIYWHPDTGAWAVLNGPFWDKWATLGWEQGRLGYPVTDQLGVPDGVGRRQHFQHGHIYWHPDTGAQTVLQGPFWEKWQALGWEQGILGYPVRDELVQPDGIGRRQDYQYGRIYWNPSTGAQAVLKNPFWGHWGPLTWETWEPGVLGYPVTDAIVNPDGVGQRQHFQHGDIYWSPATGAHTVPHGPFWDKWSTLGWEAGILGYPITDELLDPHSVGQCQGFQYGLLCWNGQISWDQPSRAYALLNGPFRDKWWELGREHGILGYPASDEYSDPSCGADGRRIDFEHASLCWTPTEGVVVYPSGDTTCLYGMPGCNRCANNIEDVFQQTPFQVTGRFKYKTALAGAPHYETGKVKRWHHHIEGFARVPITGKPLFVYTRNLPDDAPLPSTEGTGFFIIEMDGVDEQGNDGEAMQSGTQRSDRDRYSRSSHGSVRRFLRIENTDHPGGIQTIGKHLAVGSQCTKDGKSCKGRAFVDLYDLTDWQDSNAQHIRRIDMSHTGVAAVAITSLRSGRYLMFVMNHDMEDGQWLMSDRPVLQPDTQWARIDEFDMTRDVIADESDWLPYCAEVGESRLFSLSSNFYECLGANDYCKCYYKEHHAKQRAWPVRWTQPQNAALVTSCETGNLYMITSGNREFRDGINFADPDTWHETADLYKVSHRDGHFKLELIAKRRVRAVDQGSCTLRAAGGVHVTPSGDLLFYCNTHHPEGGGDGPMKFEEYHLNNFTGLR